MPLVDPAALALEAEAAAAAEVAASPFSAGAADPFLPSTSGSLEDAAANLPDCVDGSEETLPPAPAPATAAQPSAAAAPPGDPSSGGGGAASSSGSDRGMSRANSGSEPRPAAPAKPVDAVSSALKALSGIGAVVSKSRCAQGALGLCKIHVEAQAGHYSPGASRHLW